MSHQPQHRRPQSRRRAFRLILLALGLLFSAVFVSVADAETISCKTSCVIAWGHNYSGQLGDGTKGSTQTPILSEATNLVAVSAGSGHSLGLEANGTVVAWGDNTRGQLGDGTTTASPDPVQVSGLTDVKAITAGAADSFALRKDGTVWAWGYNFYGQLGIGTANNQPNPTPVQIPGLNHVVAIAADPGYSEANTLAVKDDGTVWAWGYYTYGSQFNKPAPIQVPGLTDITAIAIGTHHSLALQSNGTVWAWGKNDLGQVDISRLDAPLPIRVTGLPGATAIAAGAGYSVALLSDGSIREWGWGYTTGNVDSGVLSPIPVSVSDQTGFTAISMAESHVLALQQDGTVWAWGDNFYGQLGNGTNVGSSTPIQVVGLTGITQISAGYDDSLVVQGTASDTTPVPTPSPSPTSDDRIGAWGDSFISGEGAPNAKQGYLPGTDQPNNHCHRSSRAFPALVAKQLKMKLDFHACSGAVLADYGSPYSQNHDGKNPGEAPQRDTITKQDKLGFLVLDGNNIDFASVMTYCATRAIYQPTCEKTYGKQVASRLKKLEASKVLVQLYKDVLSRMAPGARLYVLGYPRFFPKRPPGTCWTGVALPQHPVFTRSDMAWINNNISTLDVINMRAAARVPGVQYIDNYDVLDGHEICNGKHAEWMNRTINSTNEFVRSGSFHPNTGGHAAEAKLVLNQIK